MSSQPVSFSSESEGGSIERFPIAVIGMGCRFPGGASNPEKFWEILRNAEDVITEIPDNRWHSHAFFHPDPATPGKTYVRYGGFVENLGQFDAHFFGISPREAACIDPQHRILMEVAWEALESAGLPPERLANSKTGVFVGISTCDYGGIQTAVSERESIGAYTNLGLGMCIAANRLSYFFDFHGPSLAVDTACSSSLVATHLACQSLWSEECPLALSGGVNAILRPEGTIGFSKSSMLASDGRCKAFDARADGYVRSEGGGIIVLKPLPQALSDGDPILAIIRGSACNQDGRTSGMALPNGHAQESVLREAYTRAGIDPAMVQYIEAHGTGTSAGDPIEVTALGNVLGQGRLAANQCLLGSVKSNIGHLEAASGVAGLIKSVLCIHHGEIPPNLHFERPNPRIQLDKYHFRVPREPEPWPQNGTGHRLVGVNSFGFGGTNVHLILDRPPLVRTHPKADQKQPARPMLMPLSARSSDSLKAFAERYLAFLDNGNRSRSVALSDICYTASLRRAHHSHRAALVVKSKKDLRERLHSLVEGEAHPGLAKGRQARERPSLAFVFSGMGPQWWAMGRQLMDSDDVFLKVIRDCDKAFRQYADWSLLEELKRDEEHSQVQEPDIAQAAILSVQIGLANLWRSWGIKPDVVVGHSVGEAAAAHIAGILSLEEAVRLIYHRSRLQKRAAGQGRMLSVGLPIEEVKKILNAEARHELVSIAAINSPTDVTLSGDAEVLEGIARQLNANEVFHSFLQVAVPYHSYKMEPLEAELKESLQGLDPQPAIVPMISTALGAFVQGSDLDADYWWQNVRQPVQYENALRLLIEDGYENFLELAAHPVLGVYISRCLTRAKKEGTVLPSLRKSEPDWFTMLGSLGKLYAVGFPIDWERLYPQRGRFVRLPSYPWQREHFWNESESTEQERRGLTSHPLLGNRLQCAAPTWRADFDWRTLQLLNDHRVQGTVMCPGAAFVEMALEACQELYGAMPLSVEELVLHKALFLSGRQPPKVQLSCEQGQLSFAVHSRSGQPAEPWTKHVTGKLRQLKEQTAPSQANLPEIRDRCRKMYSKSEVYAKFSSLGIDYGPLFRGLEWIQAGPSEAIGEVRLHPALKASQGDYLVHPALLDSSFQVMLGTTLPDKGDFTQSTYVPVRIHSIRWYSQPKGVVYSHARLEEKGPAGWRGSLRLLDETGKALVEVQGLLCRAIGEVSESVASYLYEQHWRLKAQPSHRPSSRAADHFQSPKEIVKRLQPEAQGLRERLHCREKYQTVEPLLDKMVVAYLLKAFKQLGCSFQPQQLFTTEELAKRHGVAPHYTRLLDRLLQTLATAGKVKQKGAKYAFADKLRFQNPVKLWQRCWGRHPEYAAELMLGRRCGEHLAEVLREEVDPLNLVFPDGSLSASEHLYQDSPSFRFYNSVVQKAVRILVGSLPPSHTIRILEIGGGTGGATTYVLKKLPAERAEYIFTDVTQMFLNHAKQKFQDYSFLRYELLDISRDPGAQGFEIHSFDLILASDVLHATPDLRTTLKHVQNLLAPRGLLILLELTRMAAWVTPIFGLLKEWWLFTDRDLRKSDPWIPLHAWRRLLPETGFAEVDAVTDTDDREGGLHSVIFARSAVAEKGVPTESELVRPQESGSWIVFADRGGFADDLAARLKAIGESVWVVSAGPSFQRFEEGRFEIASGSLEDSKRLGESWVREPAIRGVIHAWSLDAPPADGTTLSSLQAHQSACLLSALHFVQALSQLELGLKPTIWLVTGGAESIADVTTPVSVAQAPLWGLGRAIKNEYANFVCKLVDLSPRPTAQEIDLFFEELWSEDPEDELAFRGTRRYIHRLTRTSLEGIQSKAKCGEQAGEKGGFCAEIAAPGILSSLTHRQAARQSPESGEIEIVVRAVALNFKDVMVAMGLLPEEALEGGFTGRALGMECAGDVAAMGRGVRGLQIGDAVIASGPGALRSHMTVDARFVVKKPDWLTYEQAATIPIAFLTASYSLGHLARMKAGDRVLIHAAAGGVGMAALQLAHLAGAEVFATASTTEKRDLLTALGARHVMDSRSLSFSDEVKKHTEGQGVDIVLNSLSGPAIARSMAALRAYGRFVEIGKRDIYENNKLELYPFRRNLSYFAVDLDRACVERADLVRSLLEEVMQGFRDRKLHALAHRCFSISDLTNAFRYMAQAKHIGKVVISMDSTVQALPATPESLRLRPDATYLVTGGLGGFGLALSSWLVEHGARNLVLVGRRGACTPEAQEAVENIRRLGVVVAVEAVDVGKEEPLKNLLATVRSSMPPLKGIVHAAMVIDDCLLESLDEERLNKVLAPKVLGAWNLHRQTLDDALDLFICFSSFTSMIGGSGQGNYAAANAFLDALAHHRRVSGLPALTVNWGAVADVGYVAQKAEIAERLDQIGVRLMPVQKLLAILGDLIRSKGVQVGVADLDWQRISTLLSRTKRFEHLTDAAASEDGEGLSAHLLDALMAIEVKERHDYLVQHICGQLARVLGTSPSKLDIEQPLLEMGLDSLMALEIANQIQSEIDVKIPPMKFMEGLSISGLAALVIQGLGKDEAGSPGPETSAEQHQDAVDEHEVKDEVESLSEQQVDELLKDLISKE